MTAKEFYEMLKEYAKKEMIDEGRKYTETGNMAHAGASHEAAKFFQMIEMSWLDNADQPLK